MRKMFRLTLEVDYVFSSTTSEDEVKEMFSEKYIDGYHAYRDSSKLKSKLICVKEIGSLGVQRPKPH